MPQVSSFTLGGVSQSNNMDELAASIVQVSKTTTITVAVTDIPKVSDDMLYSKASGES